MISRFGTGTRIDRLNRAQWQGIETWIGPPFMANATLEWHTGVGKTHACHKAYTRFRKKFGAEDPDNNIIVVVPTIKLKEDWTGYWIQTREGNKIWKKGHIEKWDLKNIEVFVINTYITETHRCRLLIIDEIHRVLGTDADTFNKTIDITEAQFRLGLSATLTYEEKETLHAKGMPVCHTISEDEAKREGFTSDYIEYNLAIPLNHIEKAEYKNFSEMYEKNKRFFVVNDQFDFQLAMRCTSNMETCGRVARYRGWQENMGKDHPDSPTSIKKYANMWNKGMTGRKNVLYNAKGKVDATIALIEKFAELTVMTFSQTSNMADEITARIPKIARSYHTKIKGEDRVETDLFGNAMAKTKKLGAAKIKSETLHLFSTGKIRVLNAVKALDEGYDLPMINMSIITSGSSKNRQHKQRKGRSTRYDENDVNKKAIIVNLYCPDTRDEKWLKERQGDNSVVHWVEHINDIGYEEPTESEDFNINAPYSY